jgi:hypothetical protein
MVAPGEPPADKTTKEIVGEAEVEIARAAWLAREANKMTKRGIMVSKMTWDHPMVKLGMALPQRGTTQSSTDSTQPVKNGSGAGLG